MISEKLRNSIRCARDNKLVLLFKNGATVRTAFVICFVAPYRFSSFSELPGLTSLSLTVREHKPKKTRLYRPVLRKKANWQNTSEVMNCGNT